MANILSELRSGDQEADRFPEDTDQSQSKCSINSAKLKGTFTDLWRFLVLTMWRIFGFPFLLPLALTKGWSEVSRIWRPADAWMVTVAMVLNVYLQSSDVGTDLKTGMSHQHNNDSKFAALTISVTFLPFLARVFIEIKNLLSTERDVLRATLKEHLLESLQKVIAMLPFVTPFVNIMRVYELAHFKDGNVEAEKVMLGMGSHGNWEPFLEGLPQLLLQLYILFSNPQCFLNPTMISTITITVLSISFACASTFLLDRVRFPLANVLVPKIFLSIFFMTIVVPRMMNLAILCYVFNTYLSCSEMGRGVVFLSIVSVSFAALGISIKFLAKNYLSLKPVWDPIKKYGGDDYGIKGEYGEEKENGYSAYINEIKFKATLLSMFVPCIIVSNESRVFPITSVISTMLHFVILGLSWSVFSAAHYLDADIRCPIGNASTCSLMYNVTLAKDTPPMLPDATSIEGINLEIFLPITSGLLLLSILSLILIWHVSSHLNLRQVMQKLGFNWSHMSMVAFLLEKEAQLEYDMEGEAKEQAGAWMQQLSWLKNKHDMKDNPCHSILSELCKENIDCRNDVITRRNMFGTKMETVLDLSKKLRWAEIYISDILTNIHRNEVLERKNMENASKDNAEVDPIQDDFDVTESRCLCIQTSQHIKDENTTTIGAAQHKHELLMHKAIAPANVKDLFKAISKSSNPNEEDEQGDTALIKAVKLHKAFDKDVEMNSKESIAKKKQSLQICIRLLLTKGSSASHKTSTNSTAFETSSEDKECKVKMILWRYLIQQNEHCEMFTKLSTKGDVTACKYMLNNCNHDSQKKDLIEYNQNQRKRFPLLFAINASRKEMIHYLISQHKILNSKMLTKSDSIGYNALIFASQRGYDDVLEQIIDDFKNDNQLFNVNIEGRNALMLAAWHGREKCVKLLLDYFIEHQMMDIKCKVEKNALDYAKKLKRIENKFILSIKVIKKYNLY